MSSYKFLLLIAISVASIINSQGAPYNNWSPKTDENSNPDKEQLLFSKVCQSGIREDNTNYIYCARKALTHVPIFSKNNVVYDELVLADNRITELHANSFSRIKVKKIFLNGNPLRYIDKMTFRKLENHLEELWIDGDTTISSNNLLAKPLYTTNGGLPKAIVDYLRNLNTLRIKGFMVHALRNKILSKLKRIEVLSLTFCSIENIEPLAFSGLESSLKELYLDGNLMQHVPTEALLSTKFKKLKVLSLSQNYIKTISHGSFGSFYTQNKDLSSLTKLDLSYNGLKSIDSEAFINLNKTLLVLKIQNNEINSFNLAFIKNLASLVELNLAFNVITNLPGQIFENSNNLEILELQGNSIKFTQSTAAVDYSNYMPLKTTTAALRYEPSIFQGLNNLKRLNLARNGIQYLPANIFKPVNSLEGLSLDKNPVENFNKETFNGLYSNLKNLSLQNTDMLSSDLVSLEKFSSLERVKLSFNKIDDLDLKTFVKTHLSLTNLDIRKNEIKNIHFSGSSSQKKLENLVELDLSSNKLCGFNAELLSMIPQLKNLGLTQNPLYCDCNLLPLFEWSQKNFDKDIISFIQWQCELPETSSYRQFTSLTSDEFKCVGISKCVQFEPQFPIVTSTTSTTTTRARAEAIKNIGNDRLADMNVKITNVELTRAVGSIFVKWTLSSDSFTLKSPITGFTVSFNEANAKSKSFPVANSLRSFKIQNLKPNTKYSVCVTIDEYKGYDKYCREIETLSSSTTRRSEYLSTKLTASAEPSTILKNAGLISGLVITVMIVLIVFILGLLFFIYFYIKKCRSNKKLRAKSLMLSSSSSNSATMTSSRRHGNYQGPKLTTLENSKILNVHKGNCAQSSSSSSPQSTSTISNPTFCSCLQMGSNPNQQCNTMGRQFLVGDTSTVSSTLSTENLNTMAPKANPNYNMQLLPHDNAENDIFNRELVRSVPQQPGDLASSPTSFQHFTLPNQQQQQVNYLPYDVFNQNFNPNFMQQLPNNNNNSTLQYDKLTKLNKIIIANNNTMSQNSDHVYCEIPSTLGQTLNRANNNRNVLTFNGNAHMYNYNPQQNLNSLHHHIVNQSLLMSAHAAAAAPGINQSTFQSNTFTNNGKFSPSVI